MQIDYFDLTVDNEQQLQLPWPIRFFEFKAIAPKTFRVYYSPHNDATEQTATLYCIANGQELPDTFPGKYLKTIFCGFTPKNDNAIHLFIKTPVNRPKKPRRIHDKKENGGANNGDG